MDYFKPFWAGFGITLLCGVLLSVIDVVFADDIEAALAWIGAFGVMLMLALIGGVSSVILAKFALPKS